MFDFQGQVVIVTGASRGIGRRIAEDFAAEGAAVAVAARKIEDAEAVSAAIRDQGGQSIPFPLDVTSAEQVQDCVSRVADEMGRIDVLVNNAGITRDGLLMRMKDEDWQAVLETNLQGAFRMTRQAALIMLRRRYGRIVNISSVVGLSGNAGQANYAASKAGLIGFTKAVAKELASRDITVNAVAPGYVETDMTAAMTEKARAELVAQIPAKRVGSAADVSFGVRFLACKAAGYVTGHVLNINGGLYM